MASNMRYILLFLVLAIQLGCSRMAMNEDYGKSVKTNTVLQTVNISAPEESHPDVKMDGQKAAKVINNYRKEGKEAESGVMTK
jgi:hypothetical protein